MTDYTNLGHLSDKDLDVCECSDPQCGSCFGQCKESACVTVRPFGSEDEETRMCVECAKEALDSSEVTAEFDDGAFSHDEMRAMRREWINGQLHKGWKTLSLIKQQVRIEERFHRGFELKAYK